MEKADYIRLENTALECQRWSNFKASKWNIFFDVRHKMLKKNIKITLTSMTLNLDCSGAWYVAKPFITCYYWISKKFVEAQGDCKGFSGGLIRATLVSKDNSSLSESCNIPRWVAWNAKKILEKMSSTEERKDMKNKIDFAHNCTHKQNDEIKTMVSNANKQNEAIKTFLTKTEKAWAECRIKDSKCIAALSLSNSEQAIRWEEAKLERDSSMAAISLSVSEWQKLDAKLAILIDQSVKEPKSQNFQPYCSSATPDLTAQQQKVQFYSIQKLLDDKIQEVKLATKVNDSKCPRESWQGTVMALYNSQKEQISGLKSTMERNENQVRDELRSLKELMEKLLKKVEQETHKELTQSNSHNSISSQGSDPGYDTLIHSRKVSESKE